MLSVSLNEELSPFSLPILQSESGTKHREGLHKPTARDDMHLLFSLFFFFS